MESSVVQVGSWSRSEKSKDGRKKNKKYKDGGDGDDNIQPTGCWFKFKFMDSCIPSRSEVGSSTSTTSIHFGNFLLPLLSCFILFNLEKKIKALIFRRKETHSQIYFFF